MAAAAVPAPLRRGPRARRPPGRGPGRRSTSSAGPTSIRRSSPASCGPTRPAPGGCCAAGPASAGSRSGPAPAGGPAAAGHPGRAGGVTVLATLPRVTDRAERWAATMAGPPRAGSALRLAHADSRGRRRPAPRSSTASRARGPPRPSWLAPAGHPGRRRRPPRPPEEPPDPLPHLLRARPRPHPARHAPSGAWPARPRCSSSPTTTSAPASPTPSRWPRWPPSVARGLGLNVALTEAIALGHDCGHGPGGHASEDALSPYVDGRLRPRRLGRRRRARAAQPVRRDARRHPQPLLVAPGAGHARGRGGQLGRPHRLRLPRLRGRRRRRHRRRPTMLPAVGRGPLRHGPQPPARRVHRGDGRRRPRPRAASAWARTDAEALAAFRRSTTSTSTCARRRWPRPKRSSRVLRALVEHYADRPNLLPADRHGRARRRQPRGPAGRGHLRRPA